MKWSPHIKLVIGIALLIGITASLFIVINYLSEYNGLTEGTTRTIDNASVNPSLSTTQSSETNELTINTTAPTNTLSIEDFGQIVEHLYKRSSLLNEEGYDVVYAMYLIYSAAYYYRKGDEHRAYQLIKEAAKELENPPLRPALPTLNYSIYKDTLYIHRAPTVWDFVPLGTVFALSNKGYLVYPRNDPHWKLSCFIIVAIGKSSQGEVFAYQGRLPLAPWEHYFSPRIYVGGEWHVLNMDFVGPLYYDKGDKYGYPTVYEYDVSGRYMEFITYIEYNRTWIHGIVNVETGEKILYIKARAIGTPMWLGEWNRSYIVHGVYGKEKGIDLWSGFWDVCEMNATLTYGSFTRTYRGFMVFDRASHRVYYLDSSYGQLGAPLSFSCIVIYGENYDIMITNTSNPSPWDPGYPMEHQIRINLFEYNTTIDLVNYTFVDDGSIPPKNFTLYATFSNGYINLTGEVIGYWPPHWVWDKGVWWSSRGAEVWGRAFIHWVGEIVVSMGGERIIIHVDAISAGEFTRYSSTCCGCIHEPDGGCWIG